MFEIPEIVRTKATVHGADAWLSDVPDLVTELAAAWHLTVGAALPGGTEALVLEVTQRDGAQAVLKLLVPRPGDHAEREARVLGLVGGDGCAELYHHDVDRHALLLERLGPSLFDLQLPFEKRLPILCDAARRVWRPASADGFMTGAAKARWLIDFITTTWADLDQPCSEAAVDHAVDAAERRAAAHDDDRAVLVHGDVHQWNTLQTDAGYKLIDPDGLWAEAEYDLGILMREDPIELMQGDPMDRAHWLAHRTGCDSAAIWEWGVAERLSTGLLATRIGLQPEGRQMLAASDTIAGV
ncbi:MAG: phosphotransferase [Acidimicrobiales bacterium]|nr:phosphotransferase [Acidimicrobiales bacterium]